MGIWKGTAYQRTNEISDESSSAIEESGKPVRSGESRSTDEVAFLLEVEEKFLSIKGVEACHLTLSYASDNTEIASKRDFYRMIPDEKVPALVTLRGSGGEFQIRLLDDGQLELQGKSRLVGAASMLRNLHATLTRSDEPPDGSVDSAVEGQGPATTEK